MVIELRTFHCQWLFPILSILWSKNLPNWCTYCMLCVVGQQHVDSLNYRWSSSLKINDFTSLCQHPHFWLIYKHIKNGTCYWRHVFTFNSCQVPYTICSFVSLLLLVYVRIPVIANTSEADYLVHCFGKSDTCFGYGNLLLSEIWGHFRLCGVDLIVLQVMHFS